MNQPVVSFDGVSKSFQSFSLFNKKPPVTVLNNISFNLFPGQVLGVIGPNGAGKTTLLKIAGGITFPSKGSVRVSGRVAPLIEIGVGFHPEMSGRENIYLYGQILGLTLGELKKLESQIVEFSELESAINQPVKHYSSGMYVRLGFSVAVHSRPDVLLIDEAMSVGDAHFAQKGLARIQELISLGTAIVFVSHNLYLVTSLCSQVIYLKKGCCQLFHHAAKAVALYQHDLNEPFFNQNGFELLASGKKTPAGEITSTKLLSAAGKDLSRVRNNQLLAVKINYRLSSPQKEKIYLSLSLVRSDGMIYLTEDSPALPATPTGRLLAKLKLPSINPAFYAFNIKIKTLPSHQVSTQSNSDWFEVYSPKAKNKKIMTVLSLDIDWSLS